MISIQERNQQIVQMRKEGVTQAQVARKFKLSRTRIYLIERRDAAETSMAARRTKLREAIRVADDPGKLWPVNDLADAIGLFGATKNLLLDYFSKAGKGQISLKELMDMCLEVPVEGLDFMMAPLSRIRGIGKKGFWSFVNGLTGIDLGRRCNEEWQKRLVKVKQESGVTGPTPYSSSSQ